MFLTLTEALAKLAAAQAESANALKAMNEALGETDEEGEVTPATFANAEAAETALTQKVTEAEETRDAELAKTVGKQESDLRDGLVKSLGTNATLTEANLTTALDAIQAEIDNNTVVFTKNGKVNTDATDATDATFELGAAANEVLDLSGIETDNDITVNFAKVNNDNNKDDAQGGGKDTVILPSFSAGYTGTLTLEGMILGQNPDKGFDTLVAPNLASQFTKVEFETEDDKGGNGYLTVTLTNAAGGKLVLKDLIKGETFAAKFYNDGENVEFDNAGLTAFIEALNGDEGAGKLVGAWSNAADVPKNDVDADLSLTVNPSSVGEFVGQLVAYGNLKTSANTSGLEQVGFTLSDLQDAAADAAEALATARDVEADAGLLEGIVAGINGYMGAGGIDVAIDQNHTLLGLRAEITDALAANADITLEEFLDNSETGLDEEDIKALANGHVSELVLRALASGNTQEYNQKADFEVVNGVVTTTAAKAPTTGEGTWAKGAAADDDKFVFTYTPSAAEQALVDSINALGERAELIAAESDTAKALTEAGQALASTGADDLIAQLDAINGQLDVLADAEQALVDAQDALSDAQPSIDALKAAEEAQAEAEQWFEDNGYELPIDLAGTVKATAANDLFLFNPEAEAATVTNFGKAGEDSIFFGEGFKLVEVDGKVDMATAKDIGEVDALEIFWQQKGGNVELYVEAVEFAGTASGNADLTKVTLVGVNGSDLQDNLDNGLLSLGDLVA